MRNALSLLALHVLLLVSAPAWATIFTVSPGMSPPDAQPGDTVNYLTGSYGELTFPYIGSAESPIVAQCTGTCTLSSSAGVAWSGIATVTGRYLRVRGFIINLTGYHGYAGIVVQEIAHHIVLDSNVINVGGSNMLALSTEQDMSDLTLLNNTFSNCGPNNGIGCMWLNTTSRLAVVGNTMTVPGSSTNVDCMTGISPTTALIDGNTCSSSADGLDVGVEHNIAGSNTIMRYNDIRGNGSRGLPISGGDTVATTGFAWYKNVVHPTPTQHVERCNELYGFVSAGVLAYETCVGGDPSIWLQTSYDPGLVGDISLLYNVLTGNDFLIDSTSCLPAHPCPRTGNINGNPGFASTDQTSLAGLKLAANSPAIDQGQPFCRATAAGSNATTVSVTCPSKVGTDPRSYFPNPAAFYDLTNDDCKGKGVRAADYDGANNGCYDVQIAGCGKVTATSMTTDSITFTPACSWSSGAGVHVRWNGNAPDVGALEYTGASPATTTTTTSTTTTSTSSTSTTSTTTTTTTSSTTSTTLGGGDGALCLRDRNCISRNCVRSTQKYCVGP